MSLFADRRTKAQLESYRSIEQQRLDLAAEARYREAVRQNVFRRIERKVADWFEEPQSSLLRKQAE